MAWARNEIERNPGNPQGHFSLTAAAVMCGDMVAAAEALGNGLRLKPDFSVAWVRSLESWGSGFSRLYARPEFRRNDRRVEYSSES